MFFVLVVFLNIFKNCSPTFDVTALQNLAKLRTPWSQVGKSDSNLHICGFPLCSDMFPLKVKLSTIIG